MSASSEQPYLAVARKKQAERAASIPAEWTVPKHLLPVDPPLPANGPQNVLSIPVSLLAPKEVEITESYSVPSLLAAIATKKLTAVQVTDAFCHRAAIAHQLTNCITEPLFTQARARASDLDDYLLSAGEPLGPLHGLPISMKDTFNIKGVDTSVGFASLCYKPATSNAPLVDLLLSLGCVIIAKTNIPQTMMSLDSVNNVFGRTMNPANRLMTAGGSSGGEGVMVAMKANMIGIGTDIGGSIRIPAMANGIYSLKPGNYIIPYGGQFVTTTGIGRAGVQAVAGPLGRSAQDIDSFLTHVVPKCHLWGEDCRATSWSSPLKALGPLGKLTIGVLRSDGNCALLPPITNVLNEVLTKLAKLPDVSVIDLPTPAAWTKCQSVMSKLMSIEGGGAMVDLIESMKEPLVPWMQGKLRRGKPQSLERVAELQTQRSYLEREMLRLWYTTDGFGRRHRTLDAIVCPLAPHPVPEIDRYNAVGFTSSFVLLDYPTGTVPVRDVKESDLELGKPQGGESLGSWDARNRELWDETKTDRKVYLGTKLSVQVVAMKGEDERDSDGTVQVPSNVTRIARSIRPTARLPDGTEIAQVIFYQNGLGTGTNSLYNKYIGGATGGGMAEHIREAYSAICLNYTPGDEIFIMGFSRGAFTARSISSLIQAIGLLTPKGLQYFIQIFEDWEYQLKDGWKTSYPDKPWPGHKPPVTEAEYQRQLLHYELARPNIPIKSVAVWDTVGSLGIPMIGIFPQPQSRDFAFVDTKVEPNIEYAFQALALDEHRRPFTPTVWEKPKGQELPRVLKQTWFPGVHSDVGGAYTDTDLANITLCWMVNQLDGLLEFDEEYLWRQIRVGVERDEEYRKTDIARHPNRTLPPPRDWGLGKIHNSMTAFYKLSGSRIRTPNEYTNPRTAPQHGQLFYFFQRTLFWWAAHLGLFQPRRRPRLEGTNETVHASVRVRMGHRGLGYDDKGFYDSQALKGWTMYGQFTDPDTPIRQEIQGEAGRMKNVEWRKTVKNAKGEEETLVMPEDQMGDFEKRIVSLWPRIAKRLDSTLPGNHKRVLQHAHTDPLDASSSLSEDTG
ncbi:hypothetical protein DV736_g3167, partial [Chaetothyriales sp. CBS 134916]